MWDFSLFYLQAAFNVLLNRMGELFFFFEIFKVLLFIEKPLF